MMRKASLMKYLDYIVSNEDIENGKPDPEMYLKAMSFLKVQPEECLIIEDNENGIKAARASGGHLLIVENVEDVNIRNIINKIKEIDSIKHNNGD